ncbi:MBL fold metallo-hydrolase [Mycoplasma sp. Sp48II]|uniref:MBL fold metallo-hydrolase n=1 Tax=Mycoplasma sp. Sp48II TaxID=3401682 RepID=UPI003AAC1777
MKLLSYGSNSSGNCYLLHNNGLNLGFDIGKNPFTTQKSKLAWTFLKYLFISHEHTDHTEFLVTFLKNNYNAKIFINKKCYEVLVIRDKSGWVRSHIWRFIFISDYDNTWEDENIQVRAFKVNHNSMANNGYVIKFRKTQEKVAFFTDCGSLNYITTNSDIFNNCKVLLMELNHIPNSFPKTIKEEIQFSNFGHFSKAQAIEFLQKVKHKLLPNSKIFLLHASLSNYNMEKHDNDVAKKFPEFRFQRVEPLGTHLYDTELD